MHLSELPRLQVQVRAEWSSQEEYYPLPRQSVVIGEDMQAVAVPLQVVPAQAVAAPPQVVPAQDGIHVPCHWYLQCLNLRRGRCFILNVTQRTY